MGAPPAGRGACGRASKPTLSPRLRCHRSVVRPQRPDGDRHPRQLNVTDRVPRTRPGTSPSAPLCRRCLRNPVACCRLSVDDVQSESQSNVQFGAFDLIEATDGFSIEICDRYGDDVVASDDASFGQSVLGPTSTSVRIPRIVRVMGAHVIEDKTAMDAWRVRIQTGRRPAGGPRSAHTTSLRVTTPAQSAQRDGAPLAQQRRNVPDRPPPSRQRIGPSTL